MVIPHYRCNRFVDRWVQRVLRRGHPGPQAPAALPSALPSAMTAQAEP